MSSGNPAQLVAKLIDAENTGNRSLAAEILSLRFIGITRSRGIEQGREELLSELGNRADPRRHRNIDPDSILTTMSGELAIVRSVVSLQSTIDGQGDNQTFRNLHVFRREVENWRCIMWQVTERRP